MKKLNQVQKLITDAYSEIQNGVYDDNHINKAYNLITGKNPTFDDDGVIKAIRNYYHKYCEQAL